ARAGGRARRASVVPGHTRRRRDNRVLPTVRAVGGNMTTVLVIEDDAALRRALRTSLAARRLEVIDAANGEDALVLVADRRPDVALLDLGLPDVDGIEVLRRVRAFSDVPVVVLTARDRQG